jgi:sulfite reductase (NADPH) hemoprotein beta-component
MGNPANIGKIIGRSFSFAQIPSVIERLLQVYVKERFEDERFIDTVRRIGNDPFVNFVYATPVAEDESLLLPDYDLIKLGTPYDTPYYSPRF